VAIPPWLTIGQTAEYCGVHRAEVYDKAVGPPSLPAVEGGSIMQVEPPMPLRAKDDVTRRSGAHILPTICPRLQLPAVIYSDVFQLVSVRLDPLPVP